MRYTIERELPYSPSRVWEVLSDFSHFIRHDPYHHNMRYISPQERGAGTRFKMRHSYWPIFPFRRDEVIFTIERHEPEKLLRAPEVNPRAYRSHVQEFILSPNPQDPTRTLVRYNIYYITIPILPFLPLRLWAHFMVKRRMRAKLKELERDCAEYLMHSSPTPV